MTAVVITLEELGITPTIQIEEDSALWFDHSAVIAAFKANGYGPLVHVTDLYNAIFNTKFVGYCPDEAFFIEEKPRCPFFEVDEFYRSDVLEHYSGWQPNISWLLEKL